MTKPYQKVYFYFLFKLEGKFKILNQYYFVRFQNMKWNQGKLIKRTVIVLSGSIGGIIGSSQGGWMDTIAYATVWIFVAWSSLRQPTVLLMATPAFIIFGILDRSLGAATNGAFFGILTYWAVAAPDNSLRRRFSLKFFEELFNDELSKPILMFLLAFPFMLIAIFILAGTGYLIAGDVGAGIGASLGILLGVVCATRYFDRVYDQLPRRQLIMLAILTGIVSLMWERIPGGFAITLILYTTLGIGLIVWSRMKRRK
jgi:hypothetical protein